jgi:hypothetical protein
MFHFCGMPRAVPACHTLFCHDPPLRKISHLGSPRLQSLPDHPNDVPISQPHLPAGAGMNACSILQAERKNNTINGA